MNKAIMNAVGFGDEVKLVEDGRCPFCKKAISNDSFRNERSLKEYRISGLCQFCQDEVFGKD